MKESIKAPVGAFSVIVKTSWRFFSSSTVTGKLLCPRSVAWFREGDGDTREERRHNIQVNSTLFGPVPSPRWVMLVHHSLLRTRMNPGMIVRRSASRGSVATSEMSHNPRPGILLEVISQKIAHQSIVSPAWPLHTIHHNKMSPVLGDQDNLHGCL